jgi:copper chaperone CopZ
MTPSTIMGTTTQTLLRITGMSCGGCVRHVDGALRKVAGVTDVQVSLEDQNAVVTHDGSATSKALVDAIVEEGYEAEATN